VQKGLSVTTVDNHGITLLMMSLMDNQLTAAEWLVQHGVAVNATDDVGGTTLHLICGGDSTDTAGTIELLLANGADVHKRTHDGRTALDMTAEFSQVQCVKALIAAGADVHGTDDESDTMLHTAAKHGYAVPMVCLLIKAGVDLRAVNWQGKTAAQLAHDNGHTLHAQLLTRAAQQGH
jgi:ankyrin repeat protein